MIVVLRHGLIRLCLFNVSLKRLTLTLYARLAGFVCADPTVSVEVVPLSVSLVGLCQLTSCPNLEVQRLAGNSRLSDFNTALNHTHTSLQLPPDSPFPGASHGLTA